MNARRDLVMISKYLKFHLSVIMSFYELMGFQTRLFYIPGLLESIKHYKDVPKNCLA